MQDTTTAKVMRLMHDGFPPSAIDKRLGLASGLAHDIAVAEWTDDKGRKRER